MKNFEWKTTTRQQRTIRNGLLRKKVNSLLLKFKTPRILQLAHLHSASSTKKKIDQMSAGTYKQNVTIAMMLAILLSSVTKIHLQGPANPNMLLRVLERFLLVLINHYVHHLHLALSQASTFSQPLKRWLLILEPQTIFLQIEHTFLPTITIIMSSKLCPKKY